MKLKKKSNKDENTTFNYVDSFMNIVPWNSVKLPKYLFKILIFNKYTVGKQLIPVPALIRF
jgi:hypothetical protein